MKREESKNPIFWVITLDRGGLNVPLASLSLSPLSSLSPRHHKKNDSGAERAGQPRHAPRWMLTPLNCGDHQQEADGGPCAAPVGKDTC
ncbi:hypothetical protein E2C01_050152 [Portunus trituberculatus]|uniref:Uncharacterized protein n=1 Tax=Portunus trituberculatus TaxID=210409 RepID=A0A5B7GGI3_PORTR|nr:hypothetical protein [Portunus trituberculatus]